MRGAGAALLPLPNAGCGRLRCGGAAQGREENFEAGGGKTGKRRGAGERRGLTRAGDATAPGCGGSATPRLRGCSLPPPRSALYESAKKKKKKGKERGRVGGRKGKNAKEASIREGSGHPCLRSQPSATYSSRMKQPTPSQPRRSSSPGQGERIQGRKGTAERAAGRARHGAGLARCLPPSRPPFPFRPPPRP